MTPIRQTALTLLAIREHSEQELHRKLTTKGYPQTEITPLLKTLTEENLLSNARFTESYINSRRNKGYGPIRIHAELLIRGVSQDVIDHHLKMADNAWFEAAKRLWQKRFKGSIPCDYKTRAKQMRFLQYRGFTSDHIDNIYDSDNEYV